MTTEEHQPQPTDAHRIAQSARDILQKQLQRNIGQTLTDETATGMHTIFSAAIAQELEQIDDQHE